MNFPASEFTIRRGAPAIRVLAAAVLLAIGAAARAESGSQIAIKMVDGRLCARATLAGPTLSIPASIVIDLGMRAPLVVHSRTAKLLKLSPATRTTLTFGDLALPDLQTYSSEIASLEELSKEHASELDEIPAVAIMGLPALAGFGVQLDIAANQIRLLPIEDAQRRVSADPGTPGATSAPAAGAVSFVLPFEEQGSGCWMWVEAGEQFKLRTRFATSSYDTIIDATAADLAGSADGALDTLMLGSLNVAKYVALRPEDLAGAGDPRPDLIVGNNLLSHFRITIDAPNHRMLFEQTRSPQFPTEERAFFVARAAGDMPALEAFLKDHADSRLASEAAAKLLELRLEEFPADTPAIERAARWRAEHTPENRRAAGMIALADEVIAGKREDKYALAKTLLTIGTESAAADLNATATHQINARLGMIALRQNDADTARRFLISAAFSIPRDPLLNLWLGEFYESRGRLTRAWSRYIQSALDKNAPPEAMAALDRLNANPAFRAQFTMEDATQLLEGRMQEFHAPDRLSPKDAPPETVRLVELFASIDAGDTAAPELAFQALAEYLSQIPTVTIQYHISSPSADPLTTSASAARARHYAVTTAPAAIFDGENRVTTSGPADDTEKIYGKYREAAGQGTAAACTVSGTLDAFSDQLAGRVHIQPRPGAKLDNARLFLVACESIVMAPAGNGVLLHRNVARGLLSPESGIELNGSALGDGVRFAKSFKDLRTEAEASLAVVETDLSVKFLLRPLYIDPAATFVVAIVQDMPTHRVLGVAKLTRPPGSQPAL